MNWTSRYVGMPFASGGRGPGGVDCWGLVWLVYRRELGIDLPLYGEVSADDLRHIARRIRSDRDVGIWRAPASPQPFDLVLMRLQSSLSIGHVGIVVDKENMMHVESASHTAIEPMNSVNVRGRIAGFQRHCDR